MKIDLFVDLNTGDETGLPWTYADQAADPSLIAVGRRLVVGSVTPSPSPKLSASPPTASSTCAPFLVPSPRNASRPSRHTTESITKHQQERSEVNQHLRLKLSCGPVGLIMLHAESGPIAGRSTRTLRS